MSRFKTIRTYIKFSKNIQIMVLSEALCAFAFGIFFFIQILYLNSISLSPEYIGIIFSIGSSFSLLGFIVGPLIKKFGRKNILSLGFLFTALGIGMYGFFYEFSLLLIGQILINIGFCFIQVTELQLLYSYTTIEKECCAYSYKASMNLIFGAIGTLVAGNINKFYIFKNIKYKNMFLTSVAMIIVTFIIRYFFLPQDIKENRERGEIKKSIRDSLYFWRSNKMSQVFTLFLFVISIGFSGVGPYNNLVLKDFFLLDNSKISFINFSITIISMLGLVIMPTVIEKLGMKIYNMVIFSINIICCIILLMNLISRVFIIILIIRCVFSMLIVSIVDSFMMSTIAVDDRDVFAGIKLLINGIAIALGNFIGGMILNNYGYRIMYAYGGICLLIAMIFFYIKVRKYIINNKLKIKRCCHFKSYYINSKK